MSVRLEDKDGFLKAMFNIDKLPSFLVSFTGRNKKGDSYSDVINILNSGSENIPARPILENISRFYKTKFSGKALIKKIKKGIQITADDIAKSISKTVKDELFFHDIANQMFGGYAENAPATIRKKKSSIVFVDTKKLIKGVRVTKKKKA